MIYIYHIHISHFIFQLIDIYTVSISWLLKIMPRMFMYKFLMDICFKFSIGAELLDHVVTLCLIKWVTTRLLSKAAMREGSDFSIFSHSHWHFLLCGFLVPAIIVYMKWYFIFALILIYLMVNDAKHLFMCLLVISTYLLYRFVSSGELCHFLNWVVYFVKF